MSKRAAQLACEYGITYRTPVFALHKRGHYGGIVGLPFSDFSEYRDRIAQVRTQGGHFIKLMFSGILDFSRGRCDDRGSAAKTRSGADPYRARGSDFL